MAQKKTKSADQGQAEPAQAPQESQTAIAGKAEASTLKPHRYVGRTIKHFDHNGKMYQLVPNSVCLNLPAGAEQVKRFIANGELIAI